MKASQAVYIFHLLAALTLSCESAYQELLSIDDLKNIHFGQSLPKHTLLLLHWFANTVNIDNNGVIHLTFNPNTEFGSHYYGNYDRILDRQPRGYRYYTVGNLNKDRSNQLPDYVLNPPMREYEGTNMDRIIFRVQVQHSGVERVDQVYMTQHDSPSTRYDQEHTYQISTNLLRQIRLFSVGNQRQLSNLRDQFDSSADDYQLRGIINTWGYNLACVGLLLFIVIQDSKNSLSNKQQESESRPQTEEREDTQPHLESNTSNDWKKTCHLNTLVQNDREGLGLVTIFNHNIRDQSEQDGPVAPLVNNNTEQNVSSTLTQGNRVASPDDNSVPLNDRHQYWWQILFFITLSIILLVTLHVTFKSPNHNIPQHPGGITIRGYDANLELFVRKDKTCARLHVNHYFTDWTSKFYWSWVGFYKSANKDTGQYELGQWQWAVRFEPCYFSVNLKYSCFEYCSEMVAYPGVQVRFILRQNQEIARTPSFKKPEGVELTGYNAHLQLFVKNGKACARLYVKKSFRQWRSEFEQSWVGFYKSADIDTNGYERWQWQWATTFTKCPDSDMYSEYDISEYCSEILNAPGVHVRFIHRNSIEIARHPRRRYLGFGY